MIDLIHINKYYKNDEESLHVLKDVNLHIEQGEMVAVMGPSGSGKSTLINLLGFIDRKFEGTYLFEGESLVGTMMTDYQKCAIKQWALSFRILV